MNHTNETWKFPVGAFNVTVTLTGPGALVSEDIDALIEFLLLVKKNIGRGKPPSALQMMEQLS